MLNPPDNLTNVYCCSFHHTVIFQGSDVITPLVIIGKMKKTFVARSFVALSVLFLMLCLALLTGCTHHVDDAERLAPVGLFVPVSADAALSLPVSSSSLSDMTPRFSPDQEAISATPVLPTLELTLDQAIRRALDADPQIKAGLQIIRQSEADVTTAGLLPNPELLQDYLMAPLDKPFTPTRQGGPPQTDTLISFPVDWFLFGKRAAALLAAGKGVEVAQAQYADLVRQRVWGTISAFYDVLESEALLDLAKIDLDNAHQLEGITVTRAEFGGVGTIEVDRVRLFIFNAQRELRSRENARIAALARLRSFLGMQQSQPLVLKGSLDVPHPVAPLPADKAYQLALEFRPDLIARQKEVAQAKAEVDKAHTEAYPQVRPMLGYTRQFQEADLNMPNANSWNVAVTMSLPIFDRNQGNIARAESVMTQSGFNLMAQQVDLRSEIEQAVNAFQTAHDALLYDDPGQIEAAKQVRDKIRIAFELGGKPLIDVLDSQRSFRDTFRLHVVARSAYWHAFYGLNAAIGKQVLQ